MLSWNAGRLLGKLRIPFVLHININMYTLTKLTNSFQLSMFSQLSCKHDIREKLQSLLSTLNDSNASFDTSKTDQEAADESQDEPSSYGREFLINIVYYLLNLLGTYKINIIAFVIVDEDIVNEVEIPDKTQITSESRFAGVADFVDACSISTTYLSVIIITYREVKKDIISHESCGDTEDLATHEADSSNNSSPPASVPLAKVSATGPKKNLQRKL